MRRALAIASLALVAPRVARGAEPNDATLAEGIVAPTVAPPPLDTPYLQYGVAFTTEFVATAGNMCNDASPCILGSGGGVAARVGRRSAGPWYFGAAYELSKQDPGSLYRFATLQQARFEARWYLATGLDTQPYATFGGGVAGYGNEWGIDTYGPAAYAGIGFESQLSRTTVVGAAIAYRVLGLKSFVDTSGEDRPFGLVQIVGIDLSLEERDSLGWAHPVMPQ
jgi:hypothetical protein